MGNSYKTNTLCHWFSRDRRWNPWR